MGKDPERVLPTGLGALGEDSTSPDLLMVRTVLQSLPKAECPVGFEMRLQRKLEGAVEVRSSGANRNWSLGWTGVSLGFAAALAIGVFAFDVKLPAFMMGKSVPVAGTIATPADPATIASPEPQTVSVPGQEGDQLLTDEQKAVKDSTPMVAPSRELPEELFHTTTDER